MLRSFRVAGIEMNEHRSDEGTMVLILGIVSAVLILVGPAAVVMGNRALGHLAEGTQQYNYAKTGWIIGWFATVSLAFSLLIFGGLFGVMILDSIYHF